MPFLDGFRRYFFDSRSGGALYEHDDMTNSLQPPSTLGTAFQRRFPVKFDTFCHFRVNMGYALSPAARRNGVRG